MLIRDWMTKNVISVSADTSVFKSSRLMKENDIRRLPVLDAHKKVIGIVSDRDIKDASPSKATTLDTHELYYLLSELKVKDIMATKVVTISPLDTVETVAMLMEEGGFGGVPVVEEDGTLAGIITDHDIFKVLVHITGVRQGGLQLAFEMPDAPGTMRHIFDLLRNHQSSVISVLSSNNAVEQTGMRHVFVRIRPMESDAEEALIEDLRKNTCLLYWVRNKVHLNPNTCR